MSYSLNDIQDAALEFLQDEMAQEVIEDYIPNSKTLRRDAAGNVTPYVVVQFGDLQPMRSRSMVGPQGDDYGLPVYIQCISSNPSISRRVANQVVRKFLGWTTPWGGNVRKNPGFNQFVIDSSDGSVEAYAAPCFFTLTVQLSEVED